MENRKNYNKKIGLFIYLLTINNEVHISSADNSDLDFME